MTIRIKATSGTASPRSRPDRHSRLDARSCRLSQTNVPCIALLVSCAKRQFQGHLHTGIASDALQTDVLLPNATRLMQCNYLMLRPVAQTKSVPCSPRCSGCCSSAKLLLLLHVGVCPERHHTFTLLLHHRPLPFIATANLYVSAERTARTLCRITLAGCNVYDNVQQTYNLTNSKTSASNQRHGTFAAEFNRANSTI